MNNKEIRKQIIQAIWKGDFVRLDTLLYETKFNLFQKDEIENTVLDEIYLRLKEEKNLSGKIQTSFSPLNSPITFTIAHVLEKGCVDSKYEIKLKKLLSKYKILPQEKFDLFLEKGYRFLEKEHLIDPSIKRKK